VLQVPVVNVTDIKPELDPPWRFEALVVDRCMFSTGTGFRATLQDTVGQRIPAFFFREAASAHGAVVRCGTRLRLTTSTRGTRVRAVDPRYGQGFQLLVGPDAEVIASGGFSPGEPGSLARLPPPGCLVEELFAIVAEPGDLAIGESGGAYRRVVLTDESRGTIPWMTFGTAATDVPASLTRGTAIRLHMPLVAEWRGHKQLKLGRLEVLPAENARGLQLGRWWSPSA